jgi:deazaflavin-dependent oxidoreductase (nitroreductase family)
MTDIHAPGTSRVPSIVPILNPLIRRLLGAGLPFGPNVLLTVRGRKSGEPRTVPVAILDLDGRRYVQSPFGEVNWVRNLRVAGEAVVTKGRERETVSAVEVPSDAAGPLLRDALAPFFRSRLMAPVAGWLFHLSAGSSLDDYVEESRRHPMFELQSRPRPASPSD